MLKINRDTITELGFDLDTAIAECKEAFARHALTEGVPAPTFNPLVEQIVKRHGGVYEVVEAETNLPPSDPKSLSSQIDLTNARIGKIAARLIAKGIITPGDIS